MSAVPVWVPAVLLVLLALGYYQSRTREVRPSVVLLVAVAMLAFSLYGVASAFGASPVALTAWAAGYAFALLPARRFLAPRGLAASGSRVLVPGSWVPLGLMLGIFITKFFLGFAVVIGAHVLQAAWFVATAAALLGAFSGGFGARATALHRFVRAASAA